MSSCNTKPGRSSQSSKRRRTALHSSEYRLFPCDLLHPPSTFWYWCLMDHSRRHTLSSCFSNPCWSTCHLRLSHLLPLSTGSSRGKYSWSGRVRNVWPSRRLWSNHAKRLLQVFLPCLPRYSHFNCDLSQEMYHCRVRSCSPQSTRSGHLTRHWFTFSFAPTLSGEFFPTWL